MPDDGRSEDQPGWAAPVAPSAPPPATGSAPARRGRRAWLVILLVVVGVGLVAGIAGTVLFVDRTLPAYDGAHDFLDDVLHGRTAAARQRLCAADRGDAERAISEVRRSFGFRDATIQVNPLGVDRDGDHATVQYTVDVKSSSHHPTFDLPVRLEGGEWRACPSEGL